MTLTYPTAARKVVEAIRLRVPRPRELPVPRLHNRLYVFNHGWKGRACCCPLGMLPGATYPFPVGTRDLPGYDLSNLEIRAFFFWWDNLQDPVAMVDAVWGPELLEAKT